MPHPSLEKELRKLKSNLSPALIAKMRPETLFSFPAKIAIFAKNVTRKLSKTNSNVTDVTNRSIALLKYMSPITIDVFL